ncbi:DDE superfamily endonuclease [Pelomyxa schiedti]|nr:DDE superfamily endonuclease [Pelomyxa schiedti]
MDFLLLGQVHIGCNSADTFKCLFGLTPIQCNYVWATYCNDIAHPVYLLWALHFLYRYPTEPEACVAWHVSPDTFRRHTWGVIHKLYDTMTEIHFDEHLTTPTFYGACWAVDGTCIPIQRPADPVQQRYFYSGKKKQHCVNFMLVVRFGDGLIVHCPRFGLPGCIPDLTAWRFFKVADLLLPGEYGLGDKGYQGGSALLTPYKRTQQLSVEKVTFNRDHSATRIIIEHTNARVKHWTCLQVDHLHSTNSTNSTNSKLSSKVKAVTQQVSLPLVPAHTPCVDSHMRCGLPHQVLAVTLTHQLAPNVLAAMPCVSFHAMWRLTSNLLADNQFTG